MQTFTKRNGFTLLEMVIALGIFMLFMGAVLNSFISLTVAQQKANLSREGIAEAKEILNQISIEGREKRIDYFCNQGLANTNPESNQTSFSLNCQIDANTKLVLVSNDGLERLLISSTPIDDNFKQISSITETRANTLSPWSTNQTTNLHSQRLKVRDFVVNIIPTTDPYLLDSPNLQQPIVQLILIADRNSQKPNLAAEPIVIQTSLSSRAYNPQNS
jgi:prepilin-type N-terminal cleavage/methylation domain-containing protein